MPFTTIFIAHVPDADPERDTALLETDLYKLFSVLVRDTDQAIEVCRRLVAEEALDSVVLCPGNTHADVARITAALDGAVSVSSPGGTTRVGGSPARPWSAPAGSVPAPARKKRREAAVGRSRAAASLE